MSQQAKSKTSARRWLLVPVMAAALAAAYGLAGFLLVPWFAERELPRFAEEQLQHRVRIGEVSFNPFTLRLEARGFALETRDGRPVLGFADAVVDLEWQSLPRRAWVFGEVRLTDPVLQVEIAKDGRLNLAAFLPAQGGEAPAPRFAIGRLSVANGSIAFEDHRHAFRDRAERLSLELSSLSTLDAEAGSYALTGQTADGAKLQWKGEAALAPLAASGTLKVTNAALKALMPYVDDFTAERIVAGRADLDLPYHLALPGGKPVFALKGASVHLRGLALVSSGEKALLTRFGTIALEGIDLDWGKQHIALKSLRLGESSVSGAKDKRLRAKAGAVALERAEFAFATGRGSAHGITIAGALLASGDETRPIAQLRALAADGIAFDLPAQRASVKSLQAAELDARPLAQLRQIAAESLELELREQRVSVKGLQVAELDAKPLAQLRQIAFEALSFDLPAQRVSAKALRVGEFALAAARDASGELDFMRLIAGRGGDANPGAKPTAWQASIAAVELGNGSARYADATAKIPLALAADGLAGRFAFEAASAGEGVRVRVDGGNFALAKLEMLAASASAGGAPQPAIRLAKLALDGLRYDSGANAIEAGRVRLGGFGVDAELVEDRLSLLDLLPAPGKSKSGKPLSARAKRIDLGEGSIDFADRGRGIGLALERVALRLRDASTDGANPLSFRLSAEAKSGGKIALRGSAVPAQGTFEAKLEASGVVIAPAQTILAQFASVKFASGEVSLSGTLSAGGKDAKLAYSGSASIANLALEDPAGVRLVGWKSLATESLKVKLAPLDIDIDELRLTAPAGRFAIAKDGTSNFSRAFARDQAAAGGIKPAADEPAAATAVKTDGAKAGAAGSYTVDVRRVRIDQGALDFSDDSLSPGFVAKIYDLAGSANGLSSNREARAQFSLEGRVDEFGYARLSGAVNPFVPRNRSTFRVQLRNVDLTTATPYAMRFAGYRIASGRLGLDLSYRVRDSLIEGDNKITLEQFTLGEHVSSPDALKLPFELAVKLLKDPDGKISLEVPVKGNLDDPQFSLAPLIWKAVGHFIGNIAAAPFRALAHLFGGGSGEDLGAIAFDPGKARLLPPEREKLARVVETMAKHPELKLLVPAHYDSEADARALKRAALNRDIASRAGFAVAAEEEPGAVNIEDRQTRRALRAAFAERFSKADLDRLRTESEAKARAAGSAAPSMTTRLRNFASGEPQLVDTREFHQTLLRRLRESQTLPAGALAELAQGRVLAIEAALKAGGADMSRIARTSAEPGADADAKQVTCRLTLAGH